MSGLWAKISGGLLAALAIAGVMVKFLLGQNRRLKEEIKVKDTLEEIEEKQNEDQKEILKQEAKTIEKKTSNTSPISIDDLNSL